MCLIPEPDAVAIKLYCFYFLSFLVRSFYRLSKMGKAILSTTVSMELLADIGNVQHFEILLKCTYQQPHFDSTAKSENKLAQVLGTRFNGKDPPC